MDTNEWEKAYKLGWMDDSENHKIANVKQDDSSCVHINPKTKTEVRTKIQTKAKGKAQELWDRKRKE